MFNFLFYARSFIHCLSFTCERKFYARTNIKITRPFTLLPFFMGDTGQKLDWFKVNPLFSQTETDTCGRNTNPQGRGGYSMCYLKRLRLDIQLLTILNTVLKQRYSTGLWYKFIEKWYPLHIPSFKQLSEWHRWVLNILITLNTYMTDFPTLSYTSTNKIPTLSYTWNPFGQSLSLRIGFYRE